MLLSEITSKEPLEIDVCNEKVHFVNGWNEFVRVLETGITCKYSRTGDLFYLPPNSYTKSGDTKLERKVTVSLKYSLITGTLHRLTTSKIKYYEWNAHTIYGGQAKNNRTSEIRKNIF